MFQIPVGVGNRESQRAFLRKNGAFAREYRKLTELCKRTFLRSLPYPSAAEVDKLSNLPEDAPAVVSFEDKVTADRVIFYLGRVSGDDLGEILVLTGNGYGFGAQKIVRGMYERVVTGMYIAKNPAEARRFSLQSRIDRWKLWERTLVAFPKMREDKSKEEILELEAAADDARGKLRAPTCSKCKQPLPDGPWTRRSLDVMAREVDLDLCQLYGQFYLEGTAQSHANCLGMERRLQRTPRGWTYKDDSQDEGHFALHLGHHLLLRALSLQNEHFALGLDADIQERVHAFAEVWAGENRKPSAQ